MSGQHTAAPGSGHFGSLWFQFSLRTLIKLLFVNTCPPYDSHLPSYQKHLNHSSTSMNMQHLHERPLTSRALKMNLNETKVVSPVRTNCRAALELAQLIASPVEVHHTTQLLTLHMPSAAASSSLKRIHHGSRVL
ncbi:uncharacterized protein LOC143272040 [Peromyscus maniculatus bairdii]|uniref:uncharacterized protein LOC143272040 n=1 Tax=Peromyscus maniculatus bairdii TaxID=230844 RepID=UPI003FD0231F